MLRIKLMCALMALGFTSAPAIAQAQSQFRHDGNTYRYTTVTENNTIRFKGIVLETGQRFDLSVGKSGRVQGRFDGQNLSYRVSRESRDRIAARLAASLASGIDVSSR